MRPRTSSGTPGARQLVDPLLDVQGLCIGSIEEATIMPDETVNHNAFWESVVNIACKLPDYYQHASDDTYVKPSPPSRRNLG
jgi:hypothetical protein